MAFSTVASSRSAAGLGRMQPVNAQRARVVTRAEADNMSVPQQKDTVFYGGNSYTAAEVSYTVHPSCLLHRAPALTFTEIRICPWAFDEQATV